MAIFENEPASIEGLEIHDLSGPAAYLAGRACAAVGVDAWLNQLSRTDREISAVFGDYAKFSTTIDEMLQANLETVRGRRPTIGSGVLLLAKVPEISSDETVQTIGYAIVRNDATVNLTTMFISAWLKFQKPYVNIQALNVRPKYQGLGVGSALMDVALTHFADDQRLTASVLDENQTVLQTLQNTGFTIRPAGQEPKSSEYFGKNTTKATEWRLQANNVADLRAVIHERRGEHLPEYVVVTED